MIYLQLLPRFISRRICIWSCWPRRPQRCTAPCAAWWRRSATERRPTARPWGCTWHSSRDAWPRRDSLKKTYGKGWKRSRFHGDLMIFVDFYIFLDVLKIWKIWMRMHFYFWVVHENFNVCGLCDGVSAINKNPWKMDPFHRSSAALSITLRWRRWMRLGPCRNTTRIRWGT